MYKCRLSTDSRTIKNFYVDDCFLSFLVSNQKCPMFTFEDSVFLHSHVYRVWEILQDQWVNDFSETRELIYVRYLKFSTMIYNVKHATVHVYCLSLISISANLCIFLCVNGDSLCIVLLSYFIMKLFNYGPSACQAIWDHPRHESGLSTVLQKENAFLYFFSYLAGDLQELYLLPRTCSVRFSCI